MDTTSRSPATATTAAPLPALYLSHGSPMLAIEPGAPGRFMQRLGRVIDTHFGRPRAVLAVSPHTATRAPVLLGGLHHHAVHDFGGFPPALYEQRYDAPGLPALAQQAQQLLDAAGIATQIAPQGGLDHGIWTVLTHMWPQTGPEADVPVVPLSLVPAAKPAQQWRVGQALALLAAQGVLIIGSGSLTHNLQRFFTSHAPANAPEDADCAAFRQWVLSRATARDWPALLDYRAQAPHAHAMHPTDEHWLPFYIAAGAGGEQAVPARIHASVDHASLSMDAYAFGPRAAELAQRLTQEPAAEPLN